MAKRDGYIDDDGHTVADMSALRGNVEPNQSSQSASSEIQNAEEQRAVIFGVLRAGLSLGMIYIIVFGLVIAFLVWIWNH